MKKSTPNQKSPNPSQSKASKETLVTFILDKSGSMSSVRESTISGFNEYIGTLRKDKKSKYAMSLTMFDTNVEKAYVNEPLTNVKDLDTASYRPDGMTALYDATMQTIKDTEKTLRKGQKVLCIIMTDGAENSSKEYKAADMKAKIAELEKSGNWTFVFLGANQDSWLVGQQFGLSVQNVANYNSTSAGTRSAFAAVASSTMAFGGGGGSSTTTFFTQEAQDDLGKTK